MAQTPYQFRYQAVLRDTSGNVFANQNKIVKVDILQSGSSSPVFTESHAATTTLQGLINLNISSIEDLSIAD
jgi:trimeric autotransporter adhesin